MNRTGLPLLVTSLLLVLVLSVAAAGAETMPDQLFQQANEAYSRGDYPKAIDKYRQLTAVAGYSPSVLYNLANSYALSGQIGQAVLNYERALRLSPSDPDISGNLDLVKKETGLFAKEAFGAERFFRLLSLNQWSVAIVVALLAVTAFQLAAARFRFSRRLQIGVTTGCLLLFCLACAGTLAQYRYFNPSVVVDADAKLFVSPFDTAASVGTLQEGRLVYPQKRHGDFSYVTDETDRNGWIQTSMIEAVCIDTPAGR